MIEIEWVYLRLETPASPSHNQAGNSHSPYDVEVFAVFTLFRLLWPKEYHNVRSIFLECNGISKIENLEVMPQLVSLYLQSNCITRMENLDLLSNLQYLNLSHNSISEVQNLGTLSISQAFGKPFWMCLGFGFPSNYSDSSVDEALW